MTVEWPDVESWGVKAVVCPNPFCLNRDIAIEVPDNGCETMCGVCGGVCDDAPAQPSGEATA